MRTIFFLVKMIYELKFMYVNSLRNLVLEFSVFLLINIFPLVLIVFLFPLARKG